MILLNEVSTWAFFFLLQYYTMRLNELLLMLFKRDFFFFLEYWRSRYQNEFWRTQFCRQPRNTDVIMNDYKLSKAIKNYANGLMKN